MCKGVCSFPSEVMDELRSAVFEESQGESGVELHACMHACAPGCVRCFCAVISLEAQANLARLITYDHQLVGLRGLFCAQYEGDMCFELVFVQTTSQPLEAGFFDVF